MDKLKLKREERAEKQSQYEALVDLAQKSELTKEQKEQEKTLFAELSSLKDDIEQLERMERSISLRAKEKIETESRAGGPLQDNASEVKELNKIGRKYSFARAVQTIHKAKNAEAIDGVERELYEEAEKEAKEAGISLSGNIAIPSKFVQIKGKKSLLDVATEGTDAVYTEYGGLIPILRPDPITAQLGITVRSGLQGNVQWTRQNGDVSYAFETESSDVNETTPTLDNISVSPKRFGGYVDVTNQFMIQTPFAVESWLREQLEARYALTVDTQVIAGDASSNSCTGILNYSGVNVLSLGSGSANDMTYAAILEMIRLTKIAYARNGNGGWLTNATGETALARTPIQSSGVEGNFIYKPDIGTLIGRRLLTSELVPSNLSEGAQSDLCAIIFSSRWQSAILATWGGLDILFDPYTQALGGKKRFVVNAFMDVEVEQPLEFSICKDWDASDLPALT